MAGIDIVNRDNPVLRRHADMVRPEDVGTPRIQGVIRDMITALSSQKDGIAIAAPQIGESLQIFVVSGSILAQADTSYSGPATYIAFINPKITKRSKETKDVEEGCLSVRWYYGITKRHQKVTLTALDEKGNKIERGASGLLAQIFQHETDHLNGILFTDHALELWEMSPEEVAELQNKNA